MSHRATSGPEIGANIPGNLDVEVTTKKEDTNEQEKGAKEQSRPRMRRGNRVRKVEVGVEGRCGGKKCSGGSREK
jgi:hypothetical protein